MSLGLCGFSLGFVFVNGVLWVRACLLWVETAVILFCFIDCLIAQFVSLDLMLGLGCSLDLVVEFTLFIVVAYFDFDCMG